MTTVDAKSEVYKFISEWKIFFSANIGNKQEICTEKKILTTVDGKSEVC